MGHSTYQGRFFFNKLIQTHFLSAQDVEFRRFSFLHHEPLSPFIPKTHHSSQTTCLTNPVCVSNTKPTISICSLKLGKLFKNSTSSTTVFSGLHFISTILTKSRKRYLLFHNPKLKPLRKTSRNPRMPHLSFRSKSRFIRMRHPAIYPTTHQHSSHHSPKSAQTINRKGNGTKGEKANKPV